jgi:hypothetical protein
MMASLGDYPKRRYAQICPALNLVVGHYHPDPIRFHQNDVSAYVTVIIYCETSCRIFLKASEI